MSGEIPIGGVLDILRDIEERRITGRIRYTAGAQSGEVEVIGGQIALDQEPRPDGSDPVEALLALRGGSFVVDQRLPPLPVSVGDDGHRSGSLAVHVPADLMNYCESAGLTGTLKLRKEGELVELVYEAGELLAIRIDGREGADLSHVFAWSEGQFEIRVGREVRSLVPVGVVPREPEDDSAAREPTTQFIRPRTGDDTGKQFLKVFEVALTDIVATREKARPAKHTSPPRPPIASVRPPALAAPRKKREATVRIVYLAGDDESALAAIDHATRYSSSQKSSEHVVVEPSPARKTGETKAAFAPPAKPVRVDAPPPAPKVAAPPEEDDDEESDEPGAPEAVKPAAIAPRSQAENIAWWIAVVALSLILLALLSQLFPMATH